jgi:superfamily I DNA/RNA helicase
MLTAAISQGAGLIYGTFHSIAFRLLKKYPTRAGLPIDFGVADEAEARKAVTYALKEAKKKGAFVTTAQEFTPQQVGLRNEWRHCTLCHRVLPLLKDFPVLKAQRDVEV